MKPQFINLIISYQRTIIGHLEAIYKSGIYSARGQMLLTRTKQQILHAKLNHALILGSANDHPKMFFDSAEKYMKSIDNLHLDLEDFGKKISTRTEQDFLYTINYLKTLYAQNEKDLHQLISTP